MKLRSSSNMDEVSRAFELRAEMAAERSVQELLALGVQIEAAETAAAPIETGLLAASWELLVASDGFVLHNPVRYAPYVWAGRYAARVLERVQERINSALPGIARAMTR